MPIVISSYVGKLHFNQWHAGTIVVDVLATIDTQQIGIEDASLIKDKVFDLMKTSLDKIDHE
jgi:hypothetical protein